LGDLKRPFRTPFQNICVFAAHHENFNEDRLMPTISTISDRRRCSLMTLDSGYIRFMRIFAGVEASNDCEVMENVDFQGFRTLYVFGILGNEANIII